MLAQEFLHNLEQLALAALATATALDDDLRSLAGDHHVRAHAQKRVAPDGLTAFHGLQQKGVGFVIGDAEKRRDGRQQVGRHGERDGN
jgi:hypothetical protein